MSSAEIEGKWEVFSISSIYLNREIVQQLSRNCNQHQQQIRHLDINICYLSPSGRIILPIGTAERDWSSKCLCETFCLPFAWSWWEWPWSCPRGPRPCRGCRHRGWVAAPGQWTMGPPWTEECHCQLEMNIVCCCATVTSQKNEKFNFSLWIYDHLDFYWNYQRKEENGAYLREILQACFEMKIFLQYWPSPVWWQLLDDMLWQREQSGRSGES